MRVFVQVLWHSELVNLFLFSPRAVEVPRHKLLITNTISNYWLFCQLQSLNMPNAFHALLGEETSTYNNTVQERRQRCHSIYCKETESADKKKRGR